MSGYSPSQQSSATDSYIITSGSVSGVSYYITINNEIIVPSTPSNVDCSPGLNGIIVMASTSGYVLMLNDHYVENTVRFSTTNNIDVYCNGTITGPTSASKNMYIASSGLNFYNLKLNYVHLFLESMCKEINFNNIIVNALSASPCVFFGATSTLCPDHINITNAILTSGYAALSIYGSTNCNFTNILSKNCVRGYSIRGAHDCVFDNCRSEGHPIVGFLNIPTTVSTPWNKGFLNNHYNNISVSGYSEEGFSFDINDGMLWNCKISSATSAGIQFMEGSSAVSEWYKYTLEFIDGKNAAHEYDIISATSAGFVALQDFYDYADCTSGDFAVVRVKCRGNTVTNLNVYSDGDPSGLVFWAFGNGTVVRNANIYNGITTINSIIENKLMVNYCSPNNLVLDGVKHIGRTPQFYDNDGLYSGISIKRFDYQYDYSVSAINDRTIVPEKSFLYNITMINCQFVDSNIRSVLNFYEANNTGYVQYSKCKDPRNIFPTFTSNNLTVSSTNEISAFSGVIGKELVCYDSRFTKNGAKFYWDDYYNDWLLVNNQYLTLSVPTSSRYFYEFVGTSASTQLVQIGTIPKNIMRSNISTIQVDAIVQTNAATSAWLGIKFGVDAATSDSVQFSTSAPSSRGLRFNGTVGFALDGSGVYATSARQIMNSGSGTGAPRVADFSTDVPVYVSISPVTSGVTYSFTRAFIKTGLD